MHRRRAHVLVACLFATPSALPQTNAISAHRNHNHPIQPVPACHRLDAIGDQVARLERVGHAGGAHRDAVADAGHAELVADQARGGDGLADALAEAQDVLVASFGTA
jgi:hypothetical protein